jgi:hypothetical protein
MNRDHVIKAVKEALEAIPGVVEACYLDRGLREDVRDAESMAEENGAAGGLIPFVNEGVWESLRRDECFMLVVRSQTLLLEPQQGVVNLVDGTGKIIGEYLTGERRQKAREEGAIFLSDDFVIYPDSAPQGPPRFILPPLPFHELDGVSGILDVVSSSVSGPADELVRERFGHMREKHWTHLVGFNLEGAHRHQ